MKASNPMVRGPRPAPGSATRKVGKRVVLCLDDEVTIACTDDWLLVVVKGWCKPPWVSCKVFYRRAAPKNVFHVGVRADKRANNRTRDVGVLEHRYPGVLDWVIDEVVRYVKEKS